jgi:hypothetical protein
LLSAHKRTLGKAPDSGSGCRASPESPRGGGRGFFSTCPVSFGPGSQIEGDSGAVS